MSNWILSIVASYPPYEYDSWTNSTNVAEICWNIMEYHKIESFTNLNSKLVLQWFPLYINTYKPYHIYHDLRPAIRVLKGTATPVISEGQTCATRLTVICKQSISSSLSEDSTGACREVAGRIMGDASQSFVWFNKGCHQTKQLGPNK